MEHDARGGHRFHRIIRDIRHITRKLSSPILLLGYKPFVTAEFRLANKDIFFPIELEEASQNLQEVSVVASPFRKTAESPLGLRVIGFKEIEKSAGGNRDISRVVQTFPGVASTAAFRNDLMVRGGGPSENRFFLDGVEIPNINHFSTKEPPEVRSVLSIPILSGRSTFIRPHSPHPKGTL